MKEPLAQSTVAVRYGLNHKIKTECAYQNKAIPVFLGSTAALCVLSLLYLDVDWIKLAGRVPDMGSIFYRCRIWAVYFTAWHSSILNIWI